METTASPLLPLTFPSCFPSQPWFFGSLPANQAIHPYSQNLVRTVPGYGVKSRHQPGSCSVLSSALRPQPRIGLNLDLNLDPDFSFSTSSNPSSSLGL